MALTDAWIGVVWVPSLDQRSHPPRAGHKLSLNALELDLCKAYITVISSRKIRSKMD